MGRLRTILRNAQSYGELLRALRPVLVAYAWHCAWVALLTLIFGFERACLAWLVLCSAGRDASIAYGLINQRQF
ncbi:hypothetical protein NKI96_10740 [Mesorhizobium sp. M0292]|uniref:hypothetical protein n=1 Tax=Mesorhizobium sp. M0292 TaxID=2956929 RepID=UPI0033351AB7